MNRESSLRRAIAEIAQMLYLRKYVIATDGNISARLDQRQLLITPSGFCKGVLGVHDIVRVPLECDWVPDSREGAAPVLEPSSERVMHAAIYLARSDAGAVVHVHPPWATAFAVSGRKLDTSVLPETRRLDGKVARVGYHRPGSVELAEAVARALRKHNACLLAHHGLVALGSDLLEAYYRVERLEFLAQVILLASLCSLVRRNA